MTLKDIAGMAGVSVATVSHVLNHRDNKVSPEVAARVRSIIKEVNYQPNTVAKALRSSKSSIIGVMTEDLSVWQTGSIVQGVTHYAQQNGYSVILSDLGLKDKIKTDYDSIYKYRGVISKELQRLQAVRVDGVIFIGMHDRDVKGLIETDVPLVYAYCTTENADDVQVGYDNREISKKITQMLLKRYGEEIAIIGGPIQSAPAGQRMSGVEEAYAEAGVSMNLKLRQNGNWEFESGLQACRDILKSGYPVKAIYAMNDLMALGAIRQIRDCGLQVPDDIGVIGFDDSEYGWFSNPALTTVHVPLDEIGRESAAALIIRQPGLGGNEVADDLARHSADGDAEHYHRVDSCLGTCFGRDGADSVYLCRILPATTANGYF